MIGWRARLGILIPSANIVMEPTFYNMLPPGISAHFSRIPINDLTTESLKHMVDFLPERCGELSHGAMDVFGFGCTAGSFIGGPGYDLDIIKLIREHTAKPATTTTTAVLEAFSALNISRIGLATPYENWINEKEIALFESERIEVVQSKGLGLRDSDEIACYPSEKIHRLARTVDHPEAQAIFISCTNFCAVEVIETIEADLGKPIITSNQATLWAMLRLADIRNPIMGLGRLMMRL